LGTSIPVSELRPCPGVEAAGQPTFSEGRASSSRRVGRPSIVAQFASLITQWLREDPDLSGVEILRRVRLADYGGGKSALYELVKRLRVGRPVNRSRRSLQKS